MKWSSYPVHPLLLAAYPVLTLLNHNIGQVRPILGFRAFALSTVAALGLLVVLRLIIRSWATAGLIASLMIVLFYSYGPAYDLLSEVRVAETSLGRHRYLVPLWLGFLVIGAILAIRGKRSVTPALNVVALVAVAIPLVQLLSSELGVRNNSAEAENLGLELTAPDPMPDVYYIVLDAYGRQDVLQREFDLDNTNYLSQLESLGFQVAGCSMSNYSQTELTFSTALNLNYINELGDTFTEQVKDRSEMWPLIRNSRVRRVFEELGYKTVAFETGFRWSEFEDADLYLAPPKSGKVGLSVFEVTLLRSTAAWALIDQAQTLPEFLARDFDQSAEQHYDRVKFVFDQLEEAAEISGPKFVFAHIVSPHPPFIFDPSGGFRDSVADGGSVTGAEYIEGYRDQVIYLNGRVEKVVEQLIHTSEVPPIIIVQGDHGPGHGSSTDRMSILNAIRLPGGGEPFSSSISPVNTFRLLFDRVFQADLPLLQDESYFSTYDAPYDFSLVPIDCDSE
ncbi:MAG: sulfatase-like hydrolase/transferase [Anaerolineales bacterium]